MKIDIKSKQEDDKVELVDVSVSMQWCFITEMFSIQCNSVLYKGNDAFPYSQSRFDLNI